MNPDQDETTREAIVVNGSIQDAARSMADIARSLVYDLTIELSVDQIERLKSIICNARCLVSAQKRHDK